jgi:glycosyltransferase involved in cell wall biosynthesis
VKLSVLMPVYNKAPYVQEAVDSVLKGTFQDFEVVCVDDKSTDNSLTVLRSMTDPRLRIIELPRNLGPAGAANAGFDACRGEYIVRLDADDMAVPDRLAKQVAFMDAHPEIGASGGHLKLFGSRDRSWVFPLTPDDCDAQQLFGVPVSQGASILRRSVIEDHQLRYDPLWPRVGEDWLFWIRMGRVARFANLDEPMTLYRRGEQNISHGRDRFADFTYLQREVFNFYGIKHKQEELDLQLMGLYMFKIKPTKERVRSLRAWYDRLLAMNTERELFPRAAFSNRVWALWDGLFHYLPRYGAGVAMEHMRLSRSWPIDRVMYMTKYRVNALMGRVENG